MKDVDRQRIVSALTAIGLHILLIGGLALLHLSSIPPPTRMVELILVNHGDIEKPKAGSEEPARGNVRENEQPNLPAKQHSTPKSKTDKKRQDPVNSLTHNEAPKINVAVAKRRKETQQRAEQERRKEWEEIAKARKAEAERKQAEQRIGEDVAGAFGRGRSKSDSQGSGKSETGNQGQPQGSGDSYSLSGRSIVGNGGRPVRPTYALAIRGTIRVGIEVNASGLVVNAWIDPSGTNIADAGMRSSAVEAAKRTRFNEVSSAPTQRGAITYRYDFR